MTLDMKHSNRDRSPANHHGNAESRALQVIAMQRRNFLTWQPVSVKIATSEGPYNSQ